MSHIEYGDLATWTATLIAFVSLGFAVHASRKADNNQRETSALAKKTAELLEKQHQLELRSWTDQHFYAVRQWADEVCRAISEAIQIVDEPQWEKERKLDVLIRLSALLDTGRWYFPNRWGDKHGRRKHPAYRGIRQPILDCIFSAYQCLQANGESDRKDRLVNAQRDFVSHIQEVLDPQKREQEIKKILQEFKDSDRLRSVLEKSP